MDWFSGVGDDALGSFLETAQDAVHRDIGRPGIRVLWGVGALAIGERARPLVLVNAELLEEADVPWGALQGSPPPAFEVESVPESLRERLPAWIHTARPILLPVLRPEALSGSGGSTSIGTPIRCPATNTKGSVGWPVSTPAGTGFLTAGHVAAGVGDQIEEIQPGSLSKHASYAQIGTVSEHTDPVGSPGKAGYDVAVVDCTVAVSGPSPGCGIAHLAAQLPTPLAATLYGSMSGVATGGIAGALMAVGDGTRLWENCWLVIPSGLASQGDSGAALRLSGTGEVVGMVTGASRLPGGSTYAIQYAHDMESVDQHFLASRGVALL